MYYVHKTSCRILSAKCAQFPLYPYQILGTWSLNLRTKEIDLSDSMNIFFCHVVFPNAPTPEVLLNDMTGLSSSETQLTYLKIWYPRTLLTYFNCKLYSTALFANSCAKIRIIQCESSLRFH